MTPDAGAAPSAAGALDPFAFTRPQHAAAILAEFVLTFFTGELELSDDPETFGLRHKIRTGLQLAAAGGTQCAWDALEAIDFPDGDNAEDLDAILDARTTNPVFALAVGTSHRPRRLSEAIGLIEGGGYEISSPPSSLPVEEYTAAHWYGVAIGQLITELVQATLMAPAKV